MTNTDIPNNSPASTEEHDFETIVSDLKVGVLIINYGSAIKLEYANNYFYELIGYTRKEYETLFNNDITPRIYPDDVQRLKANISRQLSMGGGLRYEFRVIKKDGTIAWISINGTKHYSDTLRLRVTLIDITESKILYNDIAEKNLELDTIYNNIHGGLIKLCLPEFRVVYANDGFYKLVNLTKEEFLHKYNNIILDFLHPDDLESITSIADTCPNSAQLNFRSIDKFGETNWNLLNASRIGSLDGKPLYLCTIVDITESKRYEEQLELEQKKQHILTELAGEKMWEYNIHTNTLFRSGSTSYNYGTEAPILNYRDYMLSHNLIHSDDIPLFNYFCDSLQAGKERIESEFRIYNPDSVSCYSWNKVMATTLFDSDKTPLCVIGKTINTDSTHEALTALEEKTIRDSLTQLYNRNAYKNIIENRLASKDVILPYALILADIDNFRSINDSLGHLFGDSLLVEAANIFSMFCPTEYIGRVGTDVYAIFIENISAKEQIDDLLAQIDSLFAKIYAADKDEYKITCSMGIAFSESAEPNYEVMFRKADIALFAAKDQGKNAHVYYDVSLGFNSDNNMLNEYNMKESFSSLQASIDSALVTSAIDLLFDAKDTVSAVKILLAKIRDQFKAEYVTIVTIKEGRGDNKTIKDIWIPNSYRCSQKNYIDKEVIEQHQSLFNDDNLFYCSDISTISAITPLVYEHLKKNDTQSVLQCANIIKDKLIGFVSIASCNETRSWTVGEVRTFSILCKILFSAIGKIPIK